MKPGNDEPGYRRYSWVAWAKANRGKLSYANYGPGTLSHFLGYQLSDRFGLELTQVPYRGNAPQMVDLLAGHALFGFTQLQSAAEPSRSGQLRALVVSGPKRSALLPDVPSHGRWSEPQRYARPPAAVIRDAGGTSARAARATVRDGTG